MKRLIIFVVLLSVHYNEMHCQIPLQKIEQQSAQAAPMLEISDEINEEDLDFLETTVAVEPPLYMRWLMKIGSNTTAQIIYIQRAIVARYKAISNWWAES